MTANKVSWGYIPLAKPSAAPFTASAALTLDAKAVITAAKREYFIVSNSDVRI